MWQEARKQEKILRGIMVDYKRRAERRKGFYDKIKKDPEEFLQLWGRPCKIHIDSNLAAAADNPSVMTKWQGDESILIDRFDARSNLDYFVEYAQTSNDNETLSNEERMLNYERYRTLVQNDAVGITETQCLKQIEQEEKYGSSTEKNTNDKKSKEPKAQIGYTYEDSAPKNSYYNQPGNKSPEESEDDENEDLDIALDITKLNSEDKVILNQTATNYGMDFGDYIRMLILDYDERETIRKNKVLEAEKAQYSGRKSRRARRIAKDKRLKERGELSPLSYIVKNPEKEKNDDDEEDEDESSDKNSSKSSSRSRSRSNSSSRSRSNKKRKNKSRSNSKSPSPKSSKNAVLFITSFGAEEDDEPETSSKTAPIKKFLPNKANLNENPAANTILSQSLNLKLLKKNVTDSMRLSMSPPYRANVSPDKDTSKANVDTFKKSDKKVTSKSKSSSSDSDEISDEEEDLKNYLKRRESRKHEESKANAAFKPTTSTKNGNTDNKNLKESDSHNKTNFSNNNSNKESSTNSKFRTADEFKLYQEKLKKKMQKQLNKQLKQDQKVEREKRKKESAERREREAQLSYLTEKIRKRQAKERKKNKPDGYSSSDSDRRRSRSRSSSQDRRKARSRSRSRSRNRRKRSTSDSSSSSYRKSYDSNKNTRRSRSRSLNRNKRSPKKRSSSSSSSSSSRRDRGSRNRRRSQSSKSSSSSTSSSSSGSRYRSKKSYRSKSPRKRSRSSRSSSSS